MTLTQKLTLLLDPAFRPHRREGYAAWHASQPRWANPYPPESGPHVVWDAGWFDAHQENT